MASEDSDQIVPGLSVIHRLGDLSYLDQAVHLQVTAGGHELDAARELLEVQLLRAPHGMLPEERDDHIQEMVATTDGVAEHVLSVVVIPPIRDHAPDTEEPTKTLKTRDARGTLCHGEFVRYLEAGLVASAIRPAWLPDESDGEASFSVYETDDPATELDQPFLLVFRTRHVVTTVNAASDVTVSSAGYNRVFQHIARCAPHHC